MRFPPIPFGLLLAAGCLCCGLLISVSLGNSHHVQPIVLPAEYLLLLPALLWFFRATRPSHPASAPIPCPAIGLQLVLFLAVALPMSHLVSRGLLNPDESAYDFQARLFAGGRLMADPLPGTPARVDDTPPAFYYEGHILRPYGWFTKFPPGWPAVLACGRRLRARGVINPLLAVCLLLLVAAVTRHCFPRETAALAVLFCVLSPFFLINSVWLMSHMLCSVLVAAACWLMFRGFSSRKFGSLVEMFVLLAAACLVRPYTGAVLATALGFSVLWVARHDPQLRGRAIFAAALGAALAIGATAMYNRAYTGNALLSPYAMAAGKAAPPEISLNPAEVFHGLRFYGRRAIQESLFSTFPFVFLLAAYALFHEREGRQETWILAALYLALVAAYVLHPDGSGLHWGERFHFEAFFAVAILAARGLALLAQRWSVERPALIAGLIMLAFLQATEQGVLARAIWRNTAVYRNVRIAAQNLPAEVNLVFLHESERLVPKHLNLNDADWRHSRRVFLVDPGPGHRAEYACLFQRLNWAVVGYKESAERISVERGNVSCAAPADRARKSSE